MKVIKLYNKISPKGLGLFGEGFSCSADAENYDGILVRSADLHGEKFPESLRAIARAGAGTNNIPVSECTDKGICVFNTPGANANGVKELAICAVLLSARRIVQGAEWVKADPEKNVPAVETEKKRFAGCEIAGKTLGVFGLGAIGVITANAASALGMKVIGYDPYLSVKAALSLTPGTKIAKSPDELYAASDFITFHIPATAATKGVICAESIGKMKPGAAVINLSRDLIAVASDVKEALDSGRLSAYVTDFPVIELAGCENAIMIPHLGASTEESEENCAVMAVEQIAEYLENGNVKNSVNFPALRLAPLGKNRYSAAFLSESVAEKKLGDIIAPFGVAARETACRDGLTYTLFETEKPLSKEAIGEFHTSEGKIRLNTF